MWRLTDPLSRWTLTTLVAVVGTVFAREEKYSVTVPDVPTPGPIQDCLGCGVRSGLVVSVI